MRSLGYAHLNYDCFDCVGLSFLAAVSHFIIIELLLNHWSHYYNRHRLRVLLHEHLHHHLFKLLERQVHHSFQMMTSFDLRKTLLHQ